MGQNGQTHSSGAGTLVFSSTQVAELQILGSSNSGTSILTTILGPSASNSPVFSGSQGFGLRLHFQLS